MDALSSLPKLACKLSQINLNRRPFFFFAGLVSRESSWRLTGDRLYNCIPCREENVNWENGQILRRLYTILLLHESGQRAHQSPNGTKNQQNRRFMRATPIKFDGCSPIIATSAAESTHGVEVGRGCVLCAHKRKNGAGQPPRKSPLAQRLPVIVLRLDAWAYFANVGVSASFLGRTVRSLYAWGRR